MTFQNSSSSKWWLGAIAWLVGLMIGLSGSYAALRSSDAAMGVRIQAESEHNIRLHDATDQRLDRIEGKIDKLYELLAQRPVVQSATPLGKTR